MSHNDDDAMGALRPATVEELAALERSLIPARRAFGRGRHARSLPPSRPLIIALATAGLMIVGAGAFALERSGPNATLVQPFGAEAPFGVGYVDGFGEHTPDPSHKPIATSSRSKGPSATALPSPATSPSNDVLVVVPSGPSTSAPASAGPSSAPATEVTAVYWTTTWRSNYDAYVWVHNDGGADAAWEVRVKLPAGATVTTTMAAQRSYADGTWTFKPTGGQLLPGGRVYLFAFSGAKPDSGFALRSCTINGRACRAFS